MYEVSFVCGVDEFNEDGRRNLEKLAWLIGIFFVDLVLGNDLFKNWKYGFLKCRTKSRGLVESVRIEIN